MIIITKEQRKKWETIVQELEEECKKTPRDILVEECVELKIYKELLLNSIVLPLEESLGVVLEACYSYHQNYKKGTDVDFEDNLEFYFKEYYPYGVIIKSL
ncbi:MAG TPA: hypothetical protein PKD00_03135 [Burkholderiales bacterium]|nr:hypothetical protein [Burkholderiales bacterium]